MYDEALAYFDGDELAAKVFIDKYALRDDGGNLLEKTPEEMHRRIAREIVRVESGKFKDPLSEAQVFDLIDRFRRIVPQGSPMYGIGNPYQYASLSNCFVVASPVDSYGGILRVDQDIVQISKRRGGVGLDVSNIRPSKTRTSNAARYSTGVVPFMQRFSNSIREVGQDGRRGALMITCSVHHPEVIEFATAKADATRVTGANISVRLTDEFLNAVKQGKQYQQRWPVDSDDPVISRMVDARGVWKKIIETAHATAEPGLLFWDRVVGESPADCYPGCGTESTNPCVRGCAHVLTPDGIREVDEIGVGSRIWSKEGWTTVVAKWSTGVNKVYRYGTTASTFYGTKNHRVVSGGKKVEVGEAKSIDVLTGPEADVILNEDKQSFGDGALCGGYSPHVPERYLKGNRSVTYSFLRGLFSAHGRPHNGPMTFKTPFVKMAEDVRLMLLSVGIRSHHTTDGRFHYLDTTTDLCSNVTYPIDFVEFVAEEETFDITVDNASHTFWCDGCDVSNCGELPLSPYDSCRLLLLNLYGYVKNPFTPQSFFDFDAFREDAKLAQRLMDDIIDLEIEAVDRIIAKVEADPEADEVKGAELSLWKSVRKACTNGRRTGTGLTALGDAIAAVGLKYGADESIELAEKIYRELKLACYRSSVDMAKELGPFPAWDHEREKDHPFLNRIRQEDPQLYEDMKKYGRRNIALLTTPPAGSVSIQTQTSSGIEPVFMLSYTRRKKINPSDLASRVDLVDQSGDKWQEFTVYHPKLKEWMRVTRETDPTKSPYHGATAEEIDWKQRVRLQAAVTRHVDHSVSSTLNVPEDVSVEAVAEIYETAWEAGCKGITVYRKNCRTGVLVEKKPTIVKTTAPKRPAELPCEVYHPICGGKKYFVLVGLFEGEPYEIIAGNLHLSRSVTDGVCEKVGKGAYRLIGPHGDVLIDNAADHCSDDQEAVLRMVSTSLRHGADVRFVVEQLEKVKGDLTSFAKCLARILKKYIPDGTKVDDACGECGQNTLIRSSGCVQCTSCGWSKCS